MRGNRCLIYLILACYLIIPTFGCSNKNLTERKAEKLINAYLDSHPVTYKVWIHGPESGDVSFYEEAYKQGLLTSRTYSECRGNTEIISVLSEKGKRYLAGEEKIFDQDSVCGTLKYQPVKLAVKKVGTIVRITEPAYSGVGIKSCFVQYEITYEKTPFGEILSNAIPQPETQEIEITLYNDGWRISQ